MPARIAIPCQYFSGYCKIIKNFFNGYAFTNAFPFNRRTSPAATFQMIDFSVTDSSPLEVNVDPHETGNEPDGERLEIAAPALVI